jgi:hypothetical protein
MLAASAAGVFIDGVYPGSASTAALFRGYDLITLTAAVPLFTLALFGVRRHGLIAELLWISMLAYAAYTYAYYPHLDHLRGDAGTWCLFSPGPEMQVRLWHLKVCPVY